jgi:RNA polymerase sigma factor (TIGR02999 family)
MNDVTQILYRIESGEAGAADELIPLVHEELHRLASQKLVFEKPGQTLTTTALVNEAYLRLVGPNGQLSFQNRRHLYGAAARAMRQILIDAARRRGRDKRGGDWQRVELVDFAGGEFDETLTMLDRALDELRSRDPVAAEVVDLHHFAGMPYEKTAELLGISTYEVRRKWDFSRAWLSHQLK